MRGTVVAVLLVIVALTGSAAGVRKQWTPNWDLNTQDNWRDRRLPCAGGVASLPQYPENSLFLGADLTLGSLDLPLNGEIIFSDKGRLLFDDESTESCPGAEWTRVGQDQWWDPAAWSHPEFEDAASSPVPHLHRVPCTRDSAAFASPNNSLYTVHLAPPPVSVTTLSLGDKNYTTSEFAAYTRTSEGTMRFRGVSSTIDRAPLYIESPGECRDLTGCLCGSEQAASVICRIMSRKCGTPQCHKPINMTGFCCSVCGAEVTIDHKGTLTLETVKNLLSDLLQTPAMKDVKGHVAKLSDQLYHVYFTAANANGNYKKASEMFKTKFNEEVQMAGSHELLVSYAGDMLPLASRKIVSHQVTVTLVTLAVCLGIGAAVYYLQKRRGTSSLSFMFRRLESNSRRVSVVSDVIGGRRPSNASGVFAYSRESGLRFFNPIFNQSMASLSGVGVTSVVNEGAQQPPAEQAEGQHENPMYTAYQNMLPEEREASEEAIREREKILEATGHPVASIEPSQRSNKEKRMSAGQNLEAITEEKDMKEDSKDSGEGGEADDKEDSTKSKETDTATEQDKTSDFLQNSSLSENNVDSAAKSGENIREIDEKKETDEDNITKEEDQPSQSEVTQTLVNLDGIPALPPSVHQEHHESSSSTSSSSDDDDDDDASAALSNLEGFTPLVDMKFKK